MWEVRVDATEDGRVRVELGDTLIRGGGVESGEGGGVVPRDPVLPHGRLQYFLRGGRGGVLGGGKGLGYYGNPPWE